MNREKDLIVPKFVSVFIEPQKDHELDSKDLYKEEFKTPKSSQLPPLRGTTTIFESIPGNNSSRNETKHRRSSTLRQRTNLFSVKLNDEEEKQEVREGRLNSNEKIDDGRIVNWLNHVKKEEEILKVSFRDTESTKDSWKGSLSNKSSRRVLKNRKISSFIRTKRGKWFLVGGLIILLLVVVGATVAGFKQMKDNTHCSGGECSLNATCVDLGGNFIAQAFLDFADRSAAAWDPPIDHSRLAYTLNHYVYPSSSSSCDSQLSLLSFPSLSSLPNHLEFSRLALLHTLSLTESNTTTFRLRHFISSLKNLPSSSDSKSLKPNSNFQIISGGFTWDFSIMMRSVQDVRWEDLMKPSDSGEDEEELNRFEGRLDGLDRITSYAVASNAQRSEALKHYWMDTLEMEALELEAFKEVVRSREVLIPIEEDELTKLQEFVAQRDNDVDILQGIGCRNGLGKAVTERVDEIEHGVFGLEEISTASNESCIVSSRDLSQHPFLSLVRLDDQLIRYIFSFYQTIYRRDRFMEFSIFSTFRTLSHIPFSLLDLLSLSLPSSSLKMFRIVSLSTQEKSSRLEITNFLLRLLPFQLRRLSKGLVYCIKSITSYSITSIYSK